MPTRDRNPGIHGVPSLRPWPPTPKIQEFRGEELRTAIANLARLRPPALGLQILHRLEDARQPMRLASPEIRVVLAFGDGEQERTLWCLYFPTFDDVAALQPALCHSAAPYLVFEYAQEQLRMLAKVGIFPQRFGCIRTASTLVHRAQDVDLRQQRIAHLVAVAFRREFVYPPGIDASIAEIDALLPLMRHYTAKMRAHDLVASFELECQLLPAVVDMENTGIYVDAAAYERIAQGWSDALNNETDTDKIARLQKLVSTYRYWARDYVDVDQRIRCHLDPLATESGRFSCSNPNLQQVPSTYTAPGLRACFRAAPGHVLIIADYAQIELRVAAHLAQCEKLRQVFREGLDPHKTTAATLTGKSPDWVDDRERKLAKAVNFGFLFGMGAKRFQSYAEKSYGVHLDVNAAQSARDAFLRTFPGIARWHQQTAQMGRDGAQTIRVRTAMGRIKSFAPGRFSFNAALNIPVQGSAAEGFKRAMARLYRELPRFNAKGVLCVHDEYIAEAPREHGEAVLKLMIEVMEHEMHQLIDSVPIRAEGKIADHWG